jgi:glycosyltransferase involved in cell wall biosynthesis
VLILITVLALIAGDGWLRPHVDEFISRHHLQKWVKVLGEVPPAHMITLMSACDVTFLPSKFEGMDLATNFSVIGFLANNS